MTFWLVHQNFKRINVEISKLFVAVPMNQSKYALLSAKPLKNITWHGHGPPNDRIKHIKLDQRISILTYTIMASLSVFGILLAMGFFVFSIIFRTHR